MRQWRTPKGLAYLRRLRRRVADGRATIAEAADDAGIPRGTLCSRWRLTGIGQEIPIEQRKRATPRPARPARKYPDAEALHNARADLIMRRESVRDIAERLGVSRAWVYARWHQLGLMRDGPPRGPVSGVVRSSPVRDEVRAHLTTYPWMRPHDIANSMTADGHPISVRSVERHIWQIRRDGGDLG